MATNVFFQKGAVEKGAVVIINQKERKAAKVKAKAIGTEVKGEEAHSNFNGKEKPKTEIITLSDDEDEEDPTQRGTPVPRTFTLNSKEKYIKAGLVVDDPDALHTSGNAVSDFDQSTIVTETNDNADKIDELIRNKFNGGVFDKDGKKIDLKAILIEAGLNQRGVSSVRKEKSNYLKNRDTVLNEETRDQNNSSTFKIAPTQTQASTATKKFERCIR
uniref:Uncharacterized protein n=1 Tax=Panagrolaimus superbus TaxID=310955 RepID=A0A914Y4R4_9BILA